MEKPSLNVSQSVQLVRLHVRPQASVPADKPVSRRRSFVIHIDGIYVGMIRYEDSQWRFIASTPRFYMLDGKQFAGEAAFYQVARTLARLMYGNTLACFLTKPLMPPRANDL
jgi:hypothetical protein